MDISLSEKTPDYLFAKVAEIQNAKNVALDLLIDAMRNQATKEANLKNLEAEHEIEMQSLMANDPEVKTAKSADLRESIANVKLADLVLRIHHAKMDSLAATGFKLTVEKFHDNLRSLSTSVEQQISLAQLKYTNKP